MPPSGLSSISCANHAIHRVSREKSQLKKPAGGFSPCTHPCAFFPAGGSTISASSPVPHSGTCVGLSAIDHSSEDADAETSAIASIECKLRFVWIAPAFQPKSNPGRLDRERRLSQGAFGLGCHGAAHYDAQLGWIGLDELDRYAFGQERESGDNAFRRPVGEEHADPHAQPGAILLVIPGAAIEPEDAAETVELRTLRGIEPALLEKVCRYIFELMYLRRDRLQQSFDPRLAPELLHQTAQRICRRRKRRQDLERIRDRSQDTHGATLHIFAARSALASMSSKDETGSTPICAISPLRLCPTRTLPWKELPVAKSGLLCMPFT